MKPDWDMNAMIASHDLLWLVLDSLRYDVAVSALATGEIPHLAQLIGRWEERQTPATFTWAAHHAFFSGFLPTPVRNPRAARLFAARFTGSQTTGSGTLVFDDVYLPTVLRQRGFLTVCVGGVGFFNQRTPIGRVFPGLFAESHWSPAMGPESPTSEVKQFECAAECVRRVLPGQPLFLFMNVAAIHPPNRHYRGTPGPDDRASHLAALRAVDAQLPLLLEALALRPRPTFFIVCSDHGTAYGENGYTGHRVAHEVVWTVPYADGVVAR